MGDRQPVPLIQYYTEIDCGVALRLPIKKVKAALETGTIPGVFFYEKHYRVPEHAVPMILAAVAKEVGEGLPHMKAMSDWTDRILKFASRTALRGKTQMWIQAVEPALRKLEHMTDAFIGIACWGPVLTEKDIEPVMAKLRSCMDHDAMLAARKKQNCHRYDNKELLQAMEVIEEREKRDS